MVIVVMMTMMLMIMTKMTIDDDDDNVDDFDHVKSDDYKNGDYCCYFFFSRPRAEKNGFSHMQVNLSWNYCTKFYDDFFRLRIAI